MIRKGYHFVNYFGIVCNFVISTNLVNPGSCARGTIVGGELRDFWVLPSPQILQPIIHDEFRQDRIRMMENRRTQIFLFWICVNIRDIIKAWVKENKHAFWKSIVRIEKDRSQPVISWLYVLHCMTDCMFSFTNYVVLSSSALAVSLFLYYGFARYLYEFQLKYIYFHSGFCNIQVQFPASLDLWCHQH